MGMDVRLGPLRPRPRGSATQPHDQLPGAPREVHGGRRDHEAELPRKRTRGCVDDLGTACRTHPGNEGIVIDDRKWRVDWATREDFKFFDWSWFEGDGEGEEDKAGRSGKGGVGSSRNPSPSPSSERHGGGGSPVRENDSKDRYD